MEIIGNGFLWNAFNLPGIWIDWVIGVVVVIVIIYLMENYNSDGTKRR